MATGNRRGIGCLLVLAALVVGGWLARDTISGWLERLELGRGSVPSERLAAQAEGKIDRLVRDGLEGRLRFSEAELQSLLTYRVAPYMPPGIEQPLIDVQDSLVLLSALVLSAELEGGTAGALRAMLADSSRVAAALLPGLDSPGWLRVDVRSLNVGAVVVPPFMIPMLVEGLSSQGLQTSGGALVAPLPRDVGSVLIDGDDVVLEPVGTEIPDP